MRGKEKKKREDSTIGAVTSGAIASHAHAISHSNFQHRNPVARQITKAYRLPKCLRQRQQQQQQRRVGRRRGRKHHRCHFDLPTAVAHHTLTSGTRHFTLHEEGKNEGQSDDSEGDIRHERRERRVWFAIPPPPRVSRQKKEERYNMAQRGAIARFGGGGGSPSSSLIALCAFLLQSIPLTTVVTGHLRHNGRRHRHDHDHDHDHNHHHHHHLHGHDYSRRRRVNALLESDVAAASESESDVGRQNDYADVFDDVLACREDIADRYGADFADALAADGFHYERCDDDDDDDFVVFVDNSTDVSGQQRALHRILGATNQLHRLWTVPSYRKDDGRLHIPYAVKDVPSWFTAETHDTIRAALDTIENATGVLRFIPRVDEAEYVYFNHETHYERLCAANLGKQRGRPTNVYLGWCKGRKHLGNIMHELLHALGFWHEHSRPDRDDHVRIEWDRIDPSSTSNFAKATMVNSLGSPYDFNSIMHYPPVSFSVDRRSPTILPLRPLERWEAMGQRARLSDRDVEQLRLLYQCASGPRAGGDDVTADTLCSADCPCWEGAMGECHDDDDECLADLVCATTPAVLPGTYGRGEDALPYYEGGGGSFSCDEYCHPQCCAYANGRVHCPETCDSAPPSLGSATAGGVVPTQMCVRAYGDGKEGRSGGGGGGDVGPTTTSATAATVTTATTAATTTSNPIHPWAPWYVQWGINKCVQACDGPPPCGDGSPSQAQQFHWSVHDCCDTWLSYKEFDDCHTVPEGVVIPGTPTDAPTDPPTGPETGVPSTSEAPTSARSTNPSEGPTTTVMPSAKPTSPPSLGPTTRPTARPSRTPTEAPSEGPAVAAVASGVWYLDWDTRRCVRDCIGERPCTNRRKESWEMAFGSVEGCCDTMPYLSFEECSHLPPIRARGGGGHMNNRWYPGDSECLNDGEEPTWQHNLYSSRSVCCSSHFQWNLDDCMGTAPAASRKWYVSWARGRCVTDCDAGEGGSCGGIVPGSWIVMHGTADACCRAHMSYVPVPECRFDG